MSQLDKIQNECQTLVNKRASISAIAAVVPLPGVDIGADMALMMNLLNKINHKFGLSPGQIGKLDASVKAQIMVILTSAGTQLAGKIISKKTVTMLLKKVGKHMAVKQVTKYVPIAGQAVSASISYAAMRYLGKSHIDECYEVCKRMIEEKDRTI
ncbi:YcjF family protein [Terrilactibacillus tamarindi]|nr:YcjF family protein [Terrilactibacillus tamarindi]